MLSGTRLLLLLSSFLSLSWAVQLSTDYRRIETFQLIGDRTSRPLPDWMQPRQGYTAFDIREVGLPENFLGRARSGDRLDVRDHLFQLLGFNGRVAEATLSRNDREFTTWREYGLPAPLLASLAALTPTILTALVLGPILLRSRKRKLQARPRGDLAVVGVLLSLLPLTAALVFWVVEYSDGNGTAGVPQAMATFIGCRRGGETCWTRDVTELYRKGRIARAVAEADAAPLRPLVRCPHPFRGYLFISMDTGPRDDDLDATPVPLKESSLQYPLREWNVCNSFVFCAYPAENGTDQPVWIVSPAGVFSRRMNGGTPVRAWPAAEDLKRDWERE